MRGGHHRCHHELKVVLVRQATSAIALLLVEVSLDLQLRIVTKRMILLLLDGIQTLDLHQHPGCFLLIRHQLHYNVHIVQTQDLEVPSYHDLLNPCQRILQHGVNMYGSSL